MADSTDAFATLASELREKYLPLRLSEADTRSYLIDPVLALLGYVGVEHLRREVPVTSTKEFLDYELLVRGDPLAIVEAKALRQPILDQHSGQCVQYAAVLGVRWCFITNGVEWQLYDAHGRGPLADKRIATVRLDGDEIAVANAWNVLSLFSREALESAHPITSLLVERVLLDELSSPDSPTVAALRRALISRFGERASGAAVVAAVGTWLQGRGPALAGSRQSSPLPPPPRPAPRTTAVTSLAASGSTRRVVIADLITAGLLPEGAPIEARVNGVSHVARVSLGRIELNGQSYDSPSAASMALRRTQSWNGWIDWRYKGDTLADLRTRMLASAPTSGNATTD